MLNDPFSLPEGLRVQIPLAVQIYQSYLLWSQKAGIALEMEMPDFPSPSGIDLRSSDSNWVTIAVPHPWAVANKMRERREATYNSQTGQMDELELEALAALVGPVLGSLSGSFKCKSYLADYVDDGPKELCLAGYRTDPQTRNAYVHGYRMRSGDFMFIALQWGGLMRAHAPLEAQRLMVEQEGSFPVDPFMLLHALYFYRKQLAGHTAWFDTVGGRVSPKRDGRFDDTTYIDVRGCKDGVVACVDWNWDRRERDHRLAAYARL